MIKKLFTAFMISISLCLPFFSFAPAYAEEEPNLNYTDATNCPEFFGLKPWYCGLNLDEMNSEEKLQEGIVRIVVNVIEDAFVIAAYVLLCFILYGGFLYLVSSGDASRVTTGKKIITRSIVGIAIVAFSYIIMNTIRIIILADGGAFEACVKGTCATPETLFANALNWVFGIVATIAVIFIIYAGVLYMTSSGDGTKVMKAKQTLTYAIIGLVIIALAFSITNFVANTINNAQSDNNEGTKAAVLLEESDEILLG